MANYKTQIKVDSKTYDIGVFDSAEAAATMAHVRATDFASQDQPSRDTAKLIEQGRNLIDIRSSDPYITVHVSCS